MSKVTHSLPDDKQQFTTKSTESIKVGEKLSKKEIIIVYDNYQFRQGLKTDWGFACLVQGWEKTVLFDTGTDGYLLLQNMVKLGIDLGKIELIVLSHAHHDHTGGLDEFLAKNAGVKVFVLKSFPESLKRKAKSVGAEVIEIKEPREIIKGVFTTGEIQGGGVKEQSLILQTGQGLVLITGCAHPGVENIARQAKQQLGEAPSLLLGGFHLFRSSQNGIEELIKALKNLGVKRVAPCHCSGDTARKLFKKKFGGNFIEAGVGKKITF